MSVVKFYLDEPISTKLILDTFLTTFGVELDRGYWEWRFLKKNNESNKYIAYIMEGDTLAGYYAVSPVDIIVDGVPQKMALSNMTMTHPDYQGRGYFKLLADTMYRKLKDDGVLGVMGFANHNSHYGLRKHLGWKDLSALSIFQTRPERHRRYSTDEEYHICDLTSDLLEETRELICSESQIQITRTVDFLKWRFLQKPEQCYRAVASYKSGQLNSLTIFKPYKGEIDIMECFFPIGSSSVEHLLPSVSKLLDEMKFPVNIWSNLHSDEHIILEKHGFQETSFNSYFGVVPLNSDQITDYSKWHYRFMDSDIF